MKWNKITIKTIAEAEDIIISTMYDIGLEGAQIEDKVPLSAWEKEQMFVDILPDAPDDDGVAYLNFFVEVPEKSSEIRKPEACCAQDGNDSQEEHKTQTVDSVVQQEQELAAGLSDGVDNSYFPVSSGNPVDLEALVAQVRQELEDLRMFMDIGEGTVTVSETEDKDWVNNWKEFFHQFYIDDLLVTPSWEAVKPEDEGKKVLHIDPGTAFGTGMHETTQLCIRAIKKYVTGSTRLLDVGTGSGILGIIALMYGAASVVGTDLDPCATEAVRENLEVNGISPEHFEMMIGNIISDKEIQDRVGYEKYDIVVANILAEVLVPLTPVIVGQLKKGGIYITSGIINGKEQMVADACGQAGLEVLGINQQGEWMSVVARK